MFRSIRLSVPMSESVLIAAVSRVVLIAETIRAGDPTPWLVVCATHLNGDGYCTPEQWLHGHVCEVAHDKC